ncbi:MAG: hypothetical protein CMP23_14105 [Rickettsiales bacterium]|nr:hypothetical protein [Rickettsiales bacterium]
MGPGLSWRDNRWLFLLAAPLLALLARLFAHPAYFIDGEALITPTIGRELRHGHLLDLFHYQLIVYQGSLLLDGLLTSLGFLLFGDHLLAWQWLSLAYTVGIAAAGAVVLQRSSGSFAAFSFPLLLACAPFLVKDGLLAAIGGHTTGLFYVLVALAVALPAGPTNGRSCRPLLAGLLLGLGTWYLRSAAVAIPALLLALNPRGRDAQRRFLIGFLLFPALVLLNIAALWITDSPDAAGGVLALAAKVTWQLRELGAAERDLLAKVGEAIGLPYLSLLFAQPPSAVNSIVPERPFAYASGVLWVSGFLVASIWGLFGLLRWSYSLLNNRLKRGQQRSSGASAVALLALSWALTYVLSPLRAEAILTEWAQIEPPAAPGVNAPRYLIPIYLLWLLLLAQCLAVLARRYRRLAIAGLGLLLLVGGSQGLGDFIHDRDPSSVAERVEPYYYFKMFGPGRGPPQRIHEECRTRDPVSRGNHLAALGSFIGSTPALLASQPTADSQAVDALLERHKLTRSELQILAHGMGRALGDQMFSSFQLTSAELLEQARSSAEFLGPGVAEPYLVGVGEAMDHGRLRERQDELLAMLCRPLSWGSRPLCSLAGQMLADINLQRAPARPKLLFVAGVPELDQLPEGVRLELIRGAAIELANSALSFDVEEQDLSVWPDQDSQFFHNAWHSWRAAERWHEAGGAGFVLGDYH